MKDIATEFYKGSGVKRDEITEDGIPCIRYGEIYTEYNISFTCCKSHTNTSIKRPKIASYGDILFAATGESVDDISKSIAYLGSEVCIVGGDIIVMKHQQDPRYISYVLSTSDAIKQKKAGKVKSKVVHSHIPDIEKICIPLPNIEEQKRLANILDAFSTLTADVQAGIPSEITARQKQYEYYRDQLLSFKEVSV